MKIVVDINLLIDFSRSKKVKDSLWLNLLEYCKKEGHQLILPSIVVFEFFSGEEMNNQTNQEIAENLFNDVLILGFNEEIAKKAAAYFRKYKKSINVLDYFLAATTVVVEGELATLNSKHFKLFGDLKLFDFKKLGKYGSD
ncbi:hypothetical protein COT44_01600 [Candidatus Shapirobacteria bacterium CG08_land_8_20_14_0_20_39_18]|uniref:PIN domain-containing protein n=1 Tax=Candidatus Shapirobacteria bacterium CG08_land_8_20_14_0_20_39_18 TaxID=1974883 RepID=A0A2M6XDJ2_9BACT|nr:MAG: hypothetical protein COT44_01600 [Candidatus Shapirobacteria bacterium CG08_land_8_20_14_0_20_39_18]PIY65165.1 MAG: hypothetical protein COY91_03860 [Candidatus Shapirobacteria bacterium CG_4_10_14_0_8_um_filter_39_15]PJE67951.1 MAG: hypothetical protein COU94_04445 [Candidatus Shapirobacteria bacterium CG10_big_fil_rev_8_21_14_0_10_38_8]